MRGLEPFAKNALALVVCFAATLSLLTLAGCGSSGGDSSDNIAPAGSKVTVTQSATSWDTAGAGLGVGVNIPFDYTVVVTYPDGSPMPYANLVISGGLAYPNLSCPAGFLAGFGCHQFFGSLYFAGSTDVRSSPFPAQTDEFGTYVFSTLVSGPTGTFKDSVYIRSGANVGYGTVEIK